MSHELRTPLNAIIGFTGTMLMRLPGPLTAEQEQQLKTIQSSAKHLLSLINDMLDLTKIESGKVTLQFEPVVLQSVVAEVVETLHSLAEDKGLDLQTSLPEGAVVVMTDLRAVRQILINLANNAIKYTEKGHVRVELRRPPDAPEVIEVAVIDTGMGIKPEHQERLFQAFETLDPSNTRRYEGAGLGLYLSQKLAVLLGGRVRFTSEFGAGSVFTLSLPMPQ